MSTFAERLDDTIFAPATAPGKAAISIIRIAGPHATDVYQRMTSPRNASVSNRPPPPRRAQLRRIRHPQTDETLDEALTLFLPSESSPTGDPTLELHLHGSPAVLRATLAALSSLDETVRPAEPGEFTRRAFLRGKMDLTEVEGLRDLVEAETEAQRRLAIRQAGGQMRKTYESIRGQLVSAMGLCEAVIDFGDDGEIEDGVIEKARYKVAALCRTVEQHLDDSGRGEIMRAGIRTVIFGAPNAGKSTLLNWLAQREAAIVSPHPGTTRDVLELSLDFHGYPLVVCDTAGLRSSSDEIEMIGIERARRVVEAADLKVCVVALTETSIDPITQSLIDDDTVYIRTKSDLVEQSSISALKSHLPEQISAGKHHFHVSVQTGDGLQNFVDGLKDILRDRYNTASALEPLITSSRHRYHLSAALKSMGAFLELADPQDIVIAVEELRDASRSIGRVTGQVDVEEVFGEMSMLFPSACRLLTS